MSTIRDRISAAIEELNESYTYQQMGDALGCTRQAVSQFRAGISLPDWRKLDEIARANPCGSMPRLIACKLLRAVPPQDAYSAGMKTLPACTCPRKE